MVYLVAMWFLKVQKEFHCHFLQVIFMLRFEYLTCGYSKGHQTTYIHLFGGLGDLLFLGM